MVKLVVSYNTYNRCWLVKECYKDFYKYNAAADYSIKQKERQKGIVERIND